MILVSYYYELIDQELYKKIAWSTLTDGIFLLVDWRMVAAIKLRSVLQRKLPPRRADYTTGRESAQRVAAPHGEAGQRTQDALAPRR